MTDTTWNVQTDVTTSLMFGVNFLLEWFPHKWGVGGGGEGIICCWFVQSWLKSIKHLS